MNMTPAKMVTRINHILPIETEIPTWQTISWENIHSTVDLLAARAQQLKWRDRDYEEAIA